MLYWECQREVHEEVGREGREEKEQKEEGKVRKKMEREGNGLIQCVRAHHCRRCKWGE